MSADPLADVITLLQPRAVLSQPISGAGRWAVRYGAFGLPSFCAVLEGGCVLAVDAEDALELAQGDFVLLPATPGFTLCSLDAGAPPRALDAARVAADLARGDGADPGDGLRYGDTTGPVNLRSLGGCFEFGSPDASLLVSLLPGVLHVRGVPRLQQLVALVAEESGTRRAGRALVLTRLVELMLIEALRATPDPGAAPRGLLRGLADERLAEALRRVHAEPARAWTVASLAAAAALSRSAFHERFTRALGQAPMAYLQAWRMALAKDLLRRGTWPIAEVAERVGYGSASTFSTAFSRAVGQAPGQYAKASAAASAAGEARP